MVEAMKEKAAGVPKKITDVLATERERIKLQQFYSRHLGASMPIKYGPMSVELKEMKTMGGAVLFILEEKYVDPFGKALYSLDYGALDEKTGEIWRHGWFGAVTDRYWGVGYGKL